MKKIITKEVKVIVCDICDKTDKEYIIRKCEICNGDFCADHIYSLKSGGTHEPRETHFGGITFTTTYGNITVCKKEIVENLYNVFRLLDKNLKKNMRESAMRSK